MKMVEAMALVSGRVEKEILLRNEYLAAEQVLQIIPGNYCRKGHQANTPASAVAKNEAKCMER